MARSLVGLSGRRRLASALGVGVLAGSLALAGCSSSSPKGGGTIPPVNTAGAGGGSTASAPASGGASTGASGAASAGAVTAESLSDPDLGYTVVSIPDGLDATKTKVLQDYVAYDKATWRLWSTRQDWTRPLRFQLAQPEKIFETTKTKRRAMLDLPFQSELVTSRLSLIHI